MCQVHVHTYKADTYGNGTAYVSVNRYRMFLLFAFDVCSQGVDSKGSVELGEVFDERRRRRRSVRDLAELLFGAGDNNRRCAPSMKWLYGTVRPEDLRHSGVSAV